MNEQNQTTNTSNKSATYVVLLIVLILIVIGYFVIRSKSVTAPVAEPVASVPVPPQLVRNTTLALSPETSSTKVNGTFKIDILLNTSGQEVYGVDVNKLKFDPKILQVVDADAKTTGVQITSGTLMDMTVANKVDNKAGYIEFSQIATPQSTYNGSGVLASVTFKVLAVGTSTVAFDFALDSSTDSNIAVLGGDALSSVVNGLYVGVK